VIVAPSLLIHLRTELASIVLSGVCAAHLENIYWSIPNMLTFSDTHHQRPARTTIRSCSADAAFTMIEVMVASGLTGLVFLAFMAGLSMTFKGVQLDRENSRAAQILLEKTEVLRLYTWNQLTGADTNVYVPTNFTAPFFPDNNSGGFNYTGTVAVASVPLSETYSNDLRQVTLTLNWTSSNLQRSRSMTTLVSRYGLQNYIQ
jgi:type II secretory pathway pseudopilin PulG